MGLISDPQAAQCGVLVQYAMDMHDGAPTLTSPPPDQRLAPDWTLVGYLIAQDAIFRDSSTVGAGALVCYGYLARSTADPNSYIAVVRGTDGIVEWIEDAEFASMAHPVAGRVEAGFFGIYRSMRYARTPLAFQPEPVVEGITAAIGAGNVLVIGHSLGSALASYLAFDLASHSGSNRVSACLLASPRPGDAAFAKAFDARVGTYKLYNYELDIVPRVPVGPDYTDLPRVSWIGIDGAQARIRLGNLACHHHALCYASMLDFSLMNWTTVVSNWLQYTRCILGPAH